jgi:hypothetical protein
MGVLRTGVYIREALPIGGNGELGTRPPPPQARCDQAGTRITAWKDGISTAYLRRKRVQAIELRRDNKNSFT